MKIQWLGHAAFLISSEQEPAPGIRVITDPYTPMEGALTYAPIDAEAEVVVMSHDHGDHNNAAAVKGSPQVVKAWEMGNGSQSVGKVPFRFLSVFHDDTQGGQRGVNAISCFNIDGMWVCHMGDLGHALSPQQVEALRPVDVVMIPVGGFFTIDAITASQIADQTGAKVVIPMHVKNEKCLFPLAEISDFAALRSNVKVVDGSEVRIQRQDLAGQTQTVVMRPAL